MKSQTTPKFTFGLTLPTIKPLSDYKFPGAAIFENSLASHQASSYKGATINGLSNFSKLPISNTTKVNNNELGKISYPKSQSFNRFGDGNFNTAWDHLRDMSHAAPLFQKQKVILLAGPDSDLINYKIIEQAKVGLQNQTFHANVVQIGNGIDSLTDIHINRLYDEIQKSKERITLVIDAHGRGDSSSETHYMNLSGSHAQTNSGAFFQTISEKLSGKPIDVFFIPCNGGLVNKSIKNILPKGSNFVSLSDENNGTSVRDLANFYSNLDKQGLVNNKITAESLLSAYLTSGLKRKPTPVVTSDNKSSKLDIKIGKNSRDKFSDTEKELIFQTLTAYPDKNKLNNMIGIIENSLEKSGKAGFLTNFMLLAPEDLGLALAICHAANGKPSTLADHTTIKPNSFNATLFSQKLPPLPQSSFKLTDNKHFTVLQKK